MHDRLSALSNRIVDEQSKILDAVDERILMPTPDELRDVHLENAKVGSALLGGGCVACSHLDTIEGDEGVIGAAERAPSPIAKQAPRERRRPRRGRQRNGLSESSAARQVQSGLGKSLTRKEAEAIMMQAE